MTGLVSKFSLDDSGLCGLNAQAGGGGVELQSASNFDGVRCTFKRNAAQVLDACVSVFNVRTIKGRSTLPVNFD